jgi:8-oxo-dGTP diphosphatase
MRYTRYVLGFVFDLKFEHVLLMLKNRPVWQAGKFNGIGGHVEPGESSLEAMIREAKEEIGVATFRPPGWLPVITLKNVVRHGLVDIFVVRTTIKQLGVLQRVSVKAEEPVFYFPVDCLPPKILPNIAWIVPMAISIFKGETCHGFKVVEI